MVKCMGLAIPMVLLAVRLALAHPPSAIEIQASGERIDITVEHEVADPSGHYIARLEVFVNGRRVIEQDFLLQADAALQRAAYLVPGLEAGDEIEVEAYCNRSGRLREVLVVTGPPAG